MIMQGFVVGIEMYGLHSNIQGPQNIRLKAIPYHQRFIGKRIGLVQRVFENDRVGFFIAHFFGRKNIFKIG
jgi:hypothetical protein